MLVGKIFSLSFVILYVHKAKGLLNHAPPEAYYWRIFSGHIPEDAIKGGQERGAATYLAIALFQSNYIPAKVIPSEGRAFFEWGFQSHNVTDNIKLLCTNQIKRFFWLNVKSSDFKDRSEKFVLATKEGEGSWLYFGRANREGDVVAGKLLHNDRSVLHAAHKGGTFWTEDTFEVLFYEPPQEGEKGGTEIATAPACTCTRDVAINWFSC